jgi:hypothetical protein
VLRNASTTSEIWLPRCWWYCCSQQRRVAATIRRAFLVCGYVAHLGTERWPGGLTVEDWQVRSLHVGRLAGMGIVPVPPRRRVWLCTTTDAERDALAVKPRLDVVRRMLGRRGGAGGAHRPLPLGPLPAPWSSPPATLTPTTTSCATPEKIVNQDGTEVLQGTDVAERSDDGRLRRILMFHGPLHPRP